MESSGKAITSADNSDARCAAAIMRSTFPARSPIVVLIWPNAILILFIVSWGRIVSFRPICNRPSAPAQVQGRGPIENRSAGCNPAPLSRSPPLAQLVDRNGEDNHRPDDRLLQVRRHAEQIAAIR